MGYFTKLDKNRLGKGILNLGSASRENPPPHLPLGVPLQIPPPAKHFFPTKCQTRSGLILNQAIPTKQRRPSYCYLNKLQKSTVIFCWKKALKTGQI